MAKANSSLEVVLTPDDIPGAEPYEQHSVAALRWWLLCRYYCPYISIWKVLQKNSCTGFHIILLQRKLFQTRRSSAVFLPWNAIEAFFWVGSPQYHTLCILDLAFCSYYRFTNRANRNYSALANTF